MNLAPFDISMVIHCKSVANIWRNLTVLVKMLSVILGSIHEFTI